MFPNPLNTKEEALKAQYFVTRPDGAMVPLVAVDELPHHINIAGVSRIMTPFDIAGMTCVGRTVFRHRRHVVEDAPELAAGPEAPSQDGLSAKYFIIRDSGNMVALVAMDEMPAAFVIESVPRIVSAFDIIGMTCVGMGEPKRERSHVVEDVHRMPLSSSPLSVAGSQASHNVHTVTHTPTPELLSPILPSRPDPIINQNNFRFNRARAETSTAASLRALSMESSTHAPVFYTPSTSRVDAEDQKSILARPATVPGNEATVNEDFMPGRKKYCSFWIRHGECDYQQQGCMYLHEMPTDTEGLARLGLRDIPKWYREKHRIYSLLAEQGAGAGPGGEGLKSAVASGMLDNSRGRGAGRGGWRAKLGGNTHPVTPGHGRRGNVYNVNSNRAGMNPDSFSRAPLARPSVPLFTGTNQNRDTILGTRPVLGPSHFDELFKVKTVGSRGKHAAGSDTASVMSMGGRSMSVFSDVEAQVSRQDAERKAKEDAEYEKILQAEDRKRGAQARAAATLRGNSANTGSPSPAGRNRRGGRGGQGRGGSRKPAEKLNGKAPEKPAGDN